MALDLQDKSFLLLGRFHVGNHAELTKQIGALGGNVTKDWRTAQYIVADSVPASRKSLIDEFERQGGLVVTSGWTLSACATAADDEDTDDPLLRSALKADDIGDANMSGSSSCSKKRSRPSDEGTSSSTSISLDVVPDKDASKTTKRIKGDSHAIHLGAALQSPVLMTTDTLQSGIDQHRLTELVVPLDSCYCGARTDKVLVDDVVWDATLSLTDIAKNNNKFYIIQVTSSSHGFYCFTRWGRVGTNGTQKLEFCPLAEQAKNSFRKKFRDKTKHTFHDSSDVERKKGAYMWIQKEYSVQLQESPKSSKTKPDERVSICRLDYRVQKLVKLILDEDVMKKQVISMGLDMDKLPLGKLTKAQIGKGYLALSHILHALDNDADLEVLTDLSSTFYTLIPHRTYGRDRAAVIGTSEAVNAKLNLLQSLEDLRVGTNLLIEAQEDSCTNAELRHQLDINYEKLQCNICRLYTSRCV